MESDIVKTVSEKLKKSITPILEQSISRRSESPARSKNDSSHSWWLALAWYVHLQTNEHRDLNIEIYNIDILNIES